MTPPSPPRLLMTTDAVGGVWTFSTTLARELTLCGYKVTLAVLGPRPQADQLAALESIPNLTIETADVALEWLDPEGKDFSRALACLEQIERRCRPDIVHLNGFREALRNWRVPVVVAAHSCVRSWWQNCRGGEPTEPRWQTYARKVKAGLAAADRWVAPTNSFRDTIEQLYEPPAEGRAIWNGIAPLPLLPSGKERFILAAGRAWDEAKKIALLDRIATHLPWPIQVAGPVDLDDSGSPRPVLKNLQSLGALPHHELLGLMGRAPIFVSPAVYEPFGLTVLEAAASGCALVLSDIASFRELWDGAALFVPARDARALEAALARVTRDAKLRHELQSQAFHRARRYPLHKTVDGYIRLYDELTEPPLARSAASRRTFVGAAR